MVEARLYALLDFVRLAWLSGLPSFRLRSKCVGGVGCGVRSVGRHCGASEFPHLLSDAGAEVLGGACLPSVRSDSGGHTPSDRPLLCTVPAAPSRQNISWNVQL